MSGSHSCLAQSLVWFGSPDVFQMISFVTFWTRNNESSKETSAFQTTSILTLRRPSRSDCCSCGCMMQGREGAGGVGARRLLRVGTSMWPLACRMRVFIPQPIFGIGQSKEMWRIILRTWLPRKDSAEVTSCHLFLSPFTKEI